MFLAISAPNMLDDVVVIEDECIGCECEETDLDTRCEQSLVNRTFNTINSKVIHGKTIIHSDRGSQYTSHVFNRYVKKNGLIHSMSRPGKCIDNRPMENVWGIIKIERFKLNTYQSIEDLKQDIRAYIQFFNHKRVTLQMGLKIPA